MKKTSYILLTLIIGSLLMVSCDGLLNVDSERYTFEEDYRLGSEHDSLYSMVGILSQLQKLGDRYVLLGELRGDLMITNEKAPTILKQINDFSVSKDNPYASTKEYYAVINNCNYTIQYVDTSKNINNTKPYYKVMAAAKAIRAWTYLQLAINHGKCRYIDKPILSTTDAEKDYPEYNIQQLVDVLIEDLEPLKNVELPKLGLSSNKSLIPIRMILGDLYLWKNDYENAAKSYYDLIYNESRVINPYTNYWTFTNNVADGGRLSWFNLFRVNSTETFSILASSPDYGYAFTLDSMSYNLMFQPTDVCINNWRSSVYYESKTATAIGDMREYDSYNTTIPIGGDWTRYQNYVNENPYITKYIEMNDEDVEKNIIIYRNSLLYLRYAEAVNRLGYPNLAFAVMKTGLKSTVVRGGSVGKELRDAYGTAVPTHLDFTDFRFNENIGTRMRGSGKVNLDSTYFVIPTLATKDDSIQFVEETIVDELAMELAFEGNRYPDLMRVAVRRQNPAYLAEKVSAKYKTNKDIIKNKLMDTKNWYLP